MMKTNAEFFIDIGQEVMESIRESRENGEIRGTIGMGADGTTTSVLDQLCEDIIIGRITENDLPYNIVSEEIGKIERGYEQNLVIDPLDGTFNAENEIPLYSMSVAIMGDYFNSLDEALIMNLSNGSYYYAKKGAGAFKNSKKITVSKKRRNAYIISSGSVKEIPDYLKFAEGRFRILGCASLEMSLVAEGVFDLMAYIGGKKAIRNVDIAASTLLLREAGGLVLNEKLEDLNMGLSLLEKSQVIAISDEKLLERRRK